MSKFEARNVLARQFVKQHGARLTSAQVNKLLPLDEYSVDAHLVPVEMLSDGDVLVVDNETPNTGNGHWGHYGPYILTTVGEVMDVQRHYITEHGLDLPFNG